MTNTKTERVVSSSAVKDSLTSRIKETSTESWTVYTLEKRGEGRERFLWLPQSESNHEANSVALLKDWAKRFGKDQVRMIVRKNTTTTTTTERVIE